jgi:tagatose 6-phosphate kinase
MSSIASTGLKLGRRRNVIVTVTPNPALDITYHVDEPRHGREHRVHDVHEWPGGEGINVARVLDALGPPTLVTGIAVGGSRAVRRSHR